MPVGISPHNTAPTCYPLYLREPLRADPAPRKKVARVVPDRIMVHW
jgi:hypothetical protein